MPTADYDAGCRVRSTSTKCPTRKSRTSSSPPISRPESALASRRLFRQFSKSLAKTCKSGSRKALLHLALESKDVGYAYAKVYGALARRDIDALIAAKAEPIRSRVPLRRFRYDAKHDI